MRAATFAILAVAAALTLTAAPASAAPDTVTIDRVRATTFGVDARVDLTYKCDGGQGITQVQTLLLDSVQGPMWQAAAFADVICDGTTRTATTIHDPNVPGLMGPTSPYAHVSATLVNASGQNVGTASDIKLYFPYTLG